MIPGTRTRRKPAITLTHSDHDRLSRLADSLAVRNSDVADRLLAELDRASVVDEQQIAKNVVRMGSTLRFTADGSEARTVTLVFPGEADISAGRVSILTPIGVALIGLSTGQSIDWTARNGLTHRLTIKSVGNRSCAPLSTITGAFQPAS